MSKLPAAREKPTEDGPTGRPTCGNTGPSNRATRPTRGAFLSVTDRRKAALRQEMLAARRDLSAEGRAEASRAIAARVTALPAFAAARTVAVYRPMGAEVDTALGAAKRVAWPRIAGGAPGLDFAACFPAELVPGPRGTLAPPPGAPEVPSASLDLVLVPGLAFDAAGRRLGRGGGFYDSALAAVAGRALLVGLAFDCQIAPE